MERVQELIDKLWKQYQQQEGPESLLNTVQQLQDALAGMVRAEAPKGGGKVAVVLPPKRRTPTVEVAAPQREAPKPAPAPEAAAEQPAQPEIAQARTEIPETHLPFAGMPAPAAPAHPETPAGIQPEPAPQALRQPYTLNKPVVTDVVHPVVTEIAPAQEPAPEPEAHTEISTSPVATEPAAPEPPAAEPESEPAQALPVSGQPLPPEEREVYHLHFDMPEEAPTLTQQFAQNPRELHEMIGQKAESLNDRLKQERSELGNKLKETPIKDLRKAIGLNDKFLFIKELFRGDEAMYERSIKTINNFHILPEAEYWISRELKVKLGWEDSSSAAQSFYQLVRRRFA